MIRNFFKVAVRNLWKSKGYSFLNISGLAVGMASAMLIFMWVQNEVSYDRFYPNTDRLTMAWNIDRWDEKIQCWSTTPKMLGPALKAEYPDIEKSSRVNWDQTLLFTIGDKKLNVSGTMVDPDFLTMFSWPFERGNSNTALDNPSSIVLTRKLAIKLFGNADAMGKVIKVDNKDNFTVSGIMKDLPNNTRFRFEFLLPWSYMISHHQMDSSWGNNSTMTYALLKPNVNLASVNPKIRDISIKHQDPKATTHVFLYPMAKMRLYSEFTNGIPSGGRIETVRVFTIIAIFILLIACINFMNLSTARSEKRAKEVGIRKVAGALKNSLITQFLAESVLIAFVAGFVALLIVQLCVPAFNGLTKKVLYISYGDPVFWFAFIGFMVFTGIMAGSYPAFFLSSFKPVSVLKGTFKKANALVTPRKVLVVLQFTFAIILIISTLIIEQQIRYAQDRESGYNRNNLGFVYMSGDIDKNYALIKNDLIGQGIAITVSKTSSPITQSWSNTWGYQWEGKSPNDKSIINAFCSDGDFVATTGMKIVQGRDIDLKAFPGDSMSAVLNESSVRIMGFKHPIGQVIKYDTNYHVVGVVKDFIMESPFEPIRPIVIMGPKDRFFNVIHIRLNDRNTTKQNLAAMEKVFHQYNPEYPFDFQFADTEYAAKFSDEKVTATLAAFFAGLTIFISCLGLFGLAAYMAENRIKEIGVRKVLGASVTGISTLLSKDFVKLVIISLLIASPIAWYSMYKWLSGYPYHVPISAWIFVLAGLSAILIAIITVSFQAIRAAVANPVKSLRSE